MNKPLMFVVGLAAGVGLGMLLAPRSGEEIREMVGDKIDDATMYMKDQASGLLQKAESSAGTRSTAAGETGLGDSRDELGLPVTTDAVRL